VANVGMAAGKTVAKGAVTGVTGVANVGMAAGKTVAKGAVTGVATVGMVAAVGVAGVATGVAGVAVGTVSTVVRSTMINPRRKKYTGGRRIKRQNSRLAWDSRVTAPYIKLDLQMECHRLPKKNSFSQSDAFCCLWEIPPGHRINSKKVSKLPARHEKELGRTEVLREDRNPSFRTTFRLEYKFQEEQHYVVRVYNEDLIFSTDLKEHDFIGGCYFTLGELMGAGGCAIARPLHHGKSFLILIGQEIIETREVLEFRFAGQDLGELDRKRKNKQVAKEVAKDVIGTIQKANIANVLEKFDLYFRLEKLNKDDQTWKTVWKSEVIKDNQNPTWDGARIPLQLLCDDDPNTTIKITIWDYHKFSPDIVVGFVETTVNELILKSSRGIPVFHVMIEKKRILRGNKLKKAGVLKVLKSNIVQIPSMLQYISGGCRMDLMFAIDCTIANGDWRDEASQHFHSSTWLNDYQAAIHKIATVYGAFEGRKDYTLWGFGATLNGQQTHAPFLMGERLQDADALIEAYDRHFSEENSSYDLGKDGYWKPVIQAGMYKAVKSNQQSQCYSTLVILTTGEIADLTETIDVTCAAAEEAPMSIVIIGVGTGDFQFMDILIGCGDDSGKLRHSNGLPITRELASFVTFHEFGGNASQCVVEALRDVPEQFVQYYSNAGIKPLPPKPVPGFTGDDLRGRAAKAAARKKKNGRQAKPQYDDDESEEDYEYE
jgi:Copine/C2 domain